MQLCVEFSKKSAIFFVYFNKFDFFRKITLNITRFMLK